MSHEWDCRCPRCEDDARLDTLEEDAHPDPFTDPYGWLDWYEARHGGADAVAANFRRGYAD